MVALQLGAVEEKANGIPRPGSESRRRRTHWQPQRRLFLPVRQGQSQRIRRNSKLELGYR